MTYSLVARTRTTKGEDVRLEDKLPAVVYGKGVESASLTLEPSQFLKLYKEAGESSLIDLHIDDKDTGKVIVQDVQYDPVTERVMHVDLRRIDMNKSMTATVELRFVGESPIIKAAGGTLVTSISSVAVECLPKDLVPFIEVDLSSLCTYDDAIKVKDLVIPPGIKITDVEEESLIAKAQPALTEEEIKAMEEASSQPVDLSAIETEKKGKEEEGVEGEAAAAGEEKPVEDKKE